MQILQPSHPLSSSTSISSSHHHHHLSFSLLPRISQLSLSHKTSTIRNGGGPRTYPGGVSKWQWKRMQAKKAKQLLKARLARERQIYEMRKRAELKAAVSELERPWEVVEKPPKLFSVSADEQLKVLADRFQKPGGFDMWTENDGPQLFETPDGIPTARFFPKGVVHSVKPYQRISRDCDGNLEMESDGNLEGESNRRRDFGRKNRGMLMSGSSRRTQINGKSSNSSDSLYADDAEDEDSESFAVSSSKSWVKGRNADAHLSWKGRGLRNGSFSDDETKASESSSSLSNYRGNGSNLYKRETKNGSRGSFRKKESKGTFGSGDDENAAISLHSRRSNGRRYHRGGNFESRRDSDKKDVYNMSLQQDGSYGLEAS
ncbi:hypothetical protein Ancab_021945 [Ancistrocladus abbreviatus]